MQNISVLKTELIVYGATPAGILAAIVAARNGVKCLILEPTEHFGGLITSGLNATDLGTQKTLISVVREFYVRAGKKYDKDIELRPESKVAQQVFQEMMDESGVKLYLKHEIIRLMKGSDKVHFAEASNGSIFRASHWIDATYEGDLLPLAGVTYTMGRESRSFYGESMAGRGSPISIAPPGMDKISPNDIFGKRLKFVSDYDHLHPGDADASLQAFSFRLTLTRNQVNRLNIPDPAQYDPADFELFRRMSTGVKNNPPTLVAGTFRSMYFNLAQLPNDKYDLNSGLIPSLNLPVINSEWLNSTCKGREKIYQTYKEYTLQALYFMRTDQSVPSEIREFFSQFGLCADEYKNTGGWSPALYVREGRRLVGDTVLTQTSISDSTLDGPDSIGVARYHFDCKHTRWMVSKDGSHVVKEGMFYSKTSPMYSLDYRIMLPKLMECSNMLVTCAASASHVAFSSLRMEPHWMLLGAAAGYAVTISKNAKVNLHNVTGRKIRAMLAVQPEPTTFPLDDQRSVSHKEEAAFEIPKSKKKSFGSNLFSLFRASKETLK